MLRGLFICFLMLFAIDGKGENVSCTRFYEIMNESENAVVLDTRICKEFKTDRIPGALYAGEKKVLLKLVSDMDKDRPLLIYCTYGDRSETVIEILEEEGFKKLYHLEEGLDEWRNQGFPIDDNLVENCKK
ncbi:MAG: rhodanese-like domain-containing protein [Bacteroidota bacterium]